MILERTAKDTLTPVEMNMGDTLLFTKTDGSVVRLTLCDTGYTIISTDLRSLDQPENGWQKCLKTVYRFFCEIEAEETRYRLEREIPTLNSFYKPFSIAGLTVFFDAVSCTYKSDGGFLLEKDSAGDFFSKPNKHARFAIQDAALEICPGRLHPWCPLPEDGFHIENCYRGEDCWMGSYNGILAHGGLDINHPAGTPLFAPLDLDDQYYFNSLEMGDNNNRWLGIHRWENGSVWELRAYHMSALTVQEHTPVRQGEQFAIGAGVATGWHEHSHFAFKITECGQSYFLDPWILFWKMFRDRKLEQQSDKF